MVLDFLTNRLSCSGFSTCVWHADSFLRLLTQRNRSLNLPQMKLRHLTIGLLSPALPLKKTVFRVITANCPNPVAMDLAYSLNPHRRV